MAHGFDRLRKATCGKPEIVVSAQGSAPNLLPHRLASAEQLTCRQLGGFGVSATLGKLIPATKVRKDYLGDISRETEERMHAQGKAPPRLRLTSGPKAPWFYPENPLQEWLKSRLVTSTPSK